MEGTTDKTEDSHPLTTKWSFWFTQKKVAHEKKDSEAFAQSLEKIASFTTLEGFARSYKWLKRPSDLPPYCDLFLFRSEVKPLWENFPNGGAWIIRVLRSAPLLNLWWEDLLLAAVTEYFGDPRNVAGIALSVRKNYVTLCVWNPTEVKLEIGQKLKALFKLIDNQPLEFKTSMESIEDSSTYHHFQH